MSDPLTRRFLASRARVHRDLSRAFPSASHQDLEDALADAYADLLVRPDRQEVSSGLIYVIAWRRLRGVFRRHHRRDDRPSPEAWDLLPAAAVAPGQEIALSAGAWVRIFEEVVRTHGANHRDALRRALLDKMETGDPDVAVSQRHGLRRERVNRAWRALLDALLPG